MYIQSIYGALIRMWSPRWPGWIIDMWDPQSICGALNNVWLSRCVVLVALMDIQSMGPSSEVESLSLSAGSSVWRRSFSLVGSLPLGGLDDAWTLYTGSVGCGPSDWDSPCQDWEGPICAIGTHPRSVRARCKLETGFRSSERALIIVLKVVLARVYFLPKRIPLVS